jgi:hypothetical protein
MELLILVFRNVIETMLKKSRNLVLLEGLIYYLALQCENNVNHLFLKKQLYQILLNLDAEEEVLMQLKSLPNEYELDRLK